VIVNEVRQGVSLETLSVRGVAAGKSARPKKPAAVLKTPNPALGAHPRAAKEVLGVGINNMLTVIAGVCHLMVFSFAHISMFVISRQSRVLCDLKDEQVKHRIQDIEKLSRQSCPQHTQHCAQVSPFMFAFVSLSTLCGLILRRRVGELLLLVP
jgi:hypothetical protein